MTLLQHYIERGLIWKEDSDTYVGLADGGKTEVQIGNVGNEAAIEAYLQNNGPDDW